MQSTEGLSKSTGSTPRLFYIDHLRAFIIILVILQHVAIMYGAGVPFYYVEPPTNSPLAFLILLIFLLVNQSWFMGAFFFLSGYFTPGSFDRKGIGSFIIDRLLRLGIPIAVFYFLLSPLSSIGYWHMPSSLTGITNLISWQAYLKLLGMGPLWLAAMLLVFDIGYIIYRMLMGNRTRELANRAFKPGYLLIGISALALVGVSHLWRIILTLGKTVLDFPTLSYFPQYLGFFVLGIYLSRHDWLRKMPDVMGITGFAFAAAARVVLFPLAFSSRIFSLQPRPALSHAMGNGHWQSAVYTLWDSVFAVGVLLGAVALFQRASSAPGDRGGTSRGTGDIRQVPVPAELYGLRDAYTGCRFSRDCAEGCRTRIHGQVRYSVSHRSSGLLHRRIRYQKNTWCIEGSLIMISTNRSTWLTGTRQRGAHSDLHSKNVNITYTTLTQTGGNYVEGRKNKFMTEHTRTGSTLRVFTGFHEISCNIRGASPEGLGSVTGRPDVDWDAGPRARRC